MKARLNLLFAQCSKDFKQRTIESVYNYTLQCGHIIIYTPIYTHTELYSLGVYSQHQKISKTCLQQSGAWGQWVPGYWTPDVVIFRKFASLHLLENHLPKASITCTPSLVVWETPFAELRSLVCPRQNRPHGRSHAPQWRLSKQHRAELT